MTDRQTLIRKAALTILVVAATALAWAGTADQIARDATADNFREALAVAALARAFNGVISVAQGTEVAIQPIGVGVTLTLGEILDPIKALLQLAYRPGVGLVGNHMRARRHQLAGNVADVRAKIQNDIAGFQQTAYALQKTPSPSHPLVPFLPTTELLNLPTKSFDFRD